MKRTTPFLLLIYLFANTTLFAQTNTWTGTVDRDWHKACNWSLNIIPVCAHDVVIPNTTNKPLVTGIAHCKTVNVASASGAFLETVSSGGGIIYVSSLNAGVCSGTATDNGGCCTPWGQTQALTGGHSGYGVAADASGVYASGFHTPSAGNAAWYVQKRNLTTGALITDATTQPSATQDIAQRLYADGSWLYIAGRQANAASWRMERRSTTNLSTISYGVTSTPNTTTNDLHDVAGDATHLYMVGFDQQAVNNTRWRIEKRLLSNGTLTSAWTRDFTTNSARPDIAYGVAVDGTSIYVVGGSDGATAANNDGIWRMVKINKSTGVDQWSITNNPTVFSTAGGGGGSSEPALDVAVDATGVYVVGFSIGNPTNYQLLVQKRSLTDGSLIWNTPIATTGVVIGGSYANMAIDATGVYVTSLESGLWKVTKFNLSTGAVLCSGLASAGTRASDIVVTADGIFVAGSVSNQFRLEKMCCQ